MAIRNRKALDAGADELHPSGVSRLVRRLRHGRSAEEGTAAIEFAILLPVLLVLFLGSAEAFLMSMASRKLTRVTNTVGDLITQAKGTLNQQAINGYYAAARHIMGQFPTSRLALSVFTFTVDKRTKRPKLDWQYHRGSYRCRSRAPTLSSEQVASMRDGNDLVLTYGCYKYRVSLGRLVFSKLEMRIEEQISLRPRQRMRVPCSDCS